MTKSMDRFVFGAERLLFGVLKAPALLLGTHLLPPPTRFIQFSGQAVSSHCYPHLHTSHTSSHPGNVASSVNLCKPYKNWCLIMSGMSVAGGC